MTNENPTPALTPEQIQLVLELGKIFMPQAQRQRDELYQRQATPGEDPAAQQLRFVHYTSAEAALSITRKPSSSTVHSQCYYLDFPSGGGKLCNFVRATHLRNSLLPLLWRTIGKSTADARTGIWALSIFRL
jgi:hypothetical protein